jgi:prepilin-type N-terminal cleavage/methylation domain-containing protein
VHKNAMRPIRPLDRDRGVTLVETMAALAILAILAGIAVPMVRKSGGGAGPVGYARAIDARMALARARATASLRQQRLTVDATAILHEEATSTGLAAPAGWREVGALVAPNDVETTLEGAITFSPDGSSSSGTVTVRSVDGREQLQVSLYRTGASRVTQQW